MLNSLQFRQERGPSQSWASVCGLGTTWTTGSISYCVGSGQTCPRKVLAQTCEQQQIGDTGRTDYRTAVQVSADPGPENNNRKSLQMHCTEIHRMTRKPVNRLVRCTLKYVRNVSITYWIKKDVRNEILHVQCTTHNNVIPFYKVTGRFKSEHSHEYERIFYVNWLSGHSVFIRKSLKFYFKFAHTSGYNGPRGVRTKFI
jgi:hypothetical protein